MLHAESPASPSCLMPPTRYAIPHLFGEKVWPGQRSTILVVVSLTATIKLPRCPPSLFRRGAGNTIPIFLQDEEEIFKKEGGDSNTHQIHIYHIAVRDKLYTLTNFFLLQAVYGSSRLQVHQGCQSSPRFDAVRHTHSREHSR